MNGSIIRRILGYVIMIEAGLLLLPCVVALIYGEAQGTAFLIVAVICLVVGGLLAIKKPNSNVFYLKEGCVAVALSWLALSVFGAIPFVITGEIPSYVDALFETVSGFTTTGASILNDVEALSHCSLFWRSFTHWIGGMGILVFILAIIPLSGGSNFNLMRAESPGPSVGKLVPKMRGTAFILYAIYFAMTAIEVVLLCAGGESFFDAITTSFGTAGTGGFGIRNDSITSYSSYTQWVVTVFMVLFGVNFNVYYFILLKKIRKALSIEEARWYIGIIVIAFAIILTDTIKIYDTVSDAVLHTAFQVSSIITTTGFSTADFDTWAGYSKTVLVLLMFIGACSGSTGGGIKVSRIIIAVKSVFREFYLYVHPKSVRRIKVDGRPLEKDTLRTTNIYFLTFAMIFVVSLLLISFDGMDLVTNFTAVAATINNIGPGLEMVGPTKNFSSFGDFSKLVLLFDMLAGRLELFPMLILFNPTLWKNTVKQEALRVNRKMKK